MQPYLFPYAGYYQLVAAADHFVFYNDVQYINRGWINRNKLPHGPFAVPVVAAAQEEPIIARKIDPAHYRRFLKKWRRGFDMHYRKAAHYSAAVELIELVFQPEEESITRLAERSVTLVAAYLNLGTRFQRSSEIEYDRQFPTEEKMLSLLARLSCQHYVNLSGGRNLYHRPAFERQKIELSFLESTLDFSAETPGFGYSILHLLAHYSPEQCREWLTENYTMTHTIPHHEQQRPAE